MKQYIFSLKYVNSKIKKKYISFKNSSSSHSTSTFATSNAKHGPNQKHTAAKANDQVFQLGQDTTSQDQQIYLGRTLG